MLITHISYGAWPFLFWIVKEKGGKGEPYRVGGKLTISKKDSDAHTLTDYQKKTNEEKKILSYPPR